MLPIFPTACPVAAPVIYETEIPRWSRSAIGAFILGALLTILGILLQVLEIVRIYSGLYNFGLKNNDLSDRTQFPVISAQNGLFLFAEPWHYWPWTYAANAIGLIVMIAGIVGLMYAVRKSYSLLFTFFAFSLFAMLLPVFLIVNYSILINYYYRYISNLRPFAQIFNPFIRPDSGDISFGIAATNLSLSILTIIIAFITVIYTAISGRICTDRKNVYDYNRRNLICSNVNQAFYPPAF